MSRARGGRHPASTPEWRMLTPGHAPEDNLQGHIEFALKWEGVNLGVLEVDYLERYDEFTARVQEEVADMPERTLDLLVRFLRQHREMLSRRTRQRDFRRLTPAEVQRVEALYSAGFRKGRPSLGRDRASRSRGVY